LRGKEYVDLENKVYFEETEKAKAKYKYNLPHFPLLHFSPNLGKISFFLAVFSRRRCTRIETPLKSSFVLQIIIDWQPVKTNF
jgi:hypothetical protein